MAARITDDEWDKLSPESFETHSLLRAVDAVDELRADQEAHRAAILAQLETGADGIRWIEYLTEVGKAAKLAGGGYPNRYTAKAADVLPLIEGRSIQPAKDGVWIFGIDEGEEYAQPPGWMGKVEVHADRVAACPADQS